MKADFKTKTTFTTARERVVGYTQQADQMAAQQEAMDCFDCEAFLQIGIDAFDWLLRADRVTRLALYNGKAEYDPELDEAFQSLCRAWLTPGVRAAQWIKAQQDRGFPIENSQRFLKCCEEMKAIVDFNSRSAENLPDAMAALRDMAIQEERNGQTLDFFQEAE
jgi:hypothetical protein